jgi:FtsZ-binding cell division protein ZapB
MAGRAVCLPRLPAILLNMTFEQLQERHEALTQTVELVAADIRQLAAENRQMAAENRERDKRLGQIMESIARLVHVAEIHEHRITGLESGE